MVSVPSCSLGRGVSFGPKHSCSLVKVIQVFIPAARRNQRRPRHGRFVCTLLCVVLAGANQAPLGPLCMEKRMCENMAKQICEHLSEHLSEYLSEYISEH